MKKEIFNYIIELHNNNESLDCEKFTASYIASKLNISRNLASQYLNEYVKEDKIVKIISRPVFFYIKNYMEDTYDLKLSGSIFNSIDELICKSQKNPNDFQKLVGYNGSQKDAVEQCKSAISYPPNGLPILLTGQTGTGKSLLAQLTYEYAINQNIIQGNKKFLEVNCSEYTNNPELLSTNLFGHKKGAYTGAETDGEGLFKLADGGVLFLDEVHCLKAESQEKLFLFMDKGVYHMVGDNKTWYKSNIRIILATTENPEKALLKTLLRRIPVIINIPSLQDRSIYERKELIYKMFKNEQEKIDKNIKISNLVYQFFLANDFSGNIGSIKNCIQVICANAFFKHKTDENLLIHLYDLPKTIEKNANRINSSDDLDNTMIDINNMLDLSNTNIKILKYYSNLLNLSKNQISKKHGLEILIKEAKQQLDWYSDYIAFESKIKANPTLDFIINITEKIFSIISHRYAMDVTHNNILIFSKYIYDYSRYSDEIKVWAVENEKPISDIHLYLKENINKEYLISQEIVDNIKLNMDFTLDEMTQIAILLFIKINNNNIGSNKKFGIILSHGYSTASSIADAANKLLGEYIFDSIDMPLDLSTMTIINTLNKYIKKRSNIEELALLVDMGSLEGVYEKIEKTINCNIGIINNVTTKLALEIGSGIIKNKSLEEILDEASTNNKYVYKYINNRVKKNVILSICATGIGTSDKIKDLLIKSFPTDIDVEVISYDYDKLIKNKFEDNIFNKYNVLCVIGTVNPNIENLNFIPIEAVIDGGSSLKLDDVLSHYFSKNNLEKFNNNLLKNFSLLNLLNHLTILNAEKILEDVESTIRNIESKLNIILSKRTTLGLYVHISCMIERLITNKQVENYKDSDEFIKKEKTFIKICKESFSVVENKYGVEVPIEEIGYIFDYIKYN